MRSRRIGFRLYHLSEDGPCARVRERLQQLAMPFVAVEVPSHPEDRTELLDLTGQRRVPVLVDGEVLVIGEREVIAYVERVSTSTNQVSR